MLVFQPMEVFKAHMTGIGDHVTDQEARVHRALAEESRVRILRAVQRAAGPVDAHALAADLGLHLTTVRSHLHKLVEAGLVDVEPEERDTPGRPKLLYRADQDHGPPEDTTGYRLLSQILASHLAGTSQSPTDEAIAAGHAWGQYLTDRPPPFAQPSTDDARAHVVDLLDRLGFDPQVTDGEGRIALRHCPFLNLAREHPEVVCSIHLGLMRGALETNRAPSSDVSLEPFAEPAACIAHLPDA